jgi:hypothetical protein
MSVSTCHSPLSLSSTTSPNTDIQNLMENNADNRRLSAYSDKRINNVNYVRTVLRRFFGGSNKKSPTAAFEIISHEQSPTTDLNHENLSSPILIYPDLQYDKHSKFSGKY